MGILTFALIALGLFYLVIALISLIRLIKVIAENAIKISLAFYIGMLIASIARAVSLYLISKNIIPSIGDPKEDLSVFLFLMIIIPDMLLMCVYLFLVWYFFSFYIISHINLANDLSLFIKNEDVPTIKKKTYKVLYVTIPVYMTAFVTLCLLSYYEVIKDTVLFTINSFFNIATPFLFVGYYIFLLFKFSGRPYIEEKYGAQSRSTLIIVLIWSAARLVIGILELVFSTLSLYTIINDYPSHEDNIMYSVGIILYFIVLEYVPDFFALDYSLMKTYINPVPDCTEPQKILFEEENTLDAKKIDNINTSENGSSYMDRDARSPKKTVSNKQNVNTLIVPFSEINLLQVMFNKKNGLGIVYKATFRGKDVACRLVAFDRLSRYDLEGLSKDMEEIINLNHSYVCPVIGICVENNPNIYILTPLFKNGSLHETLHENKIELDLKKRMEIAKKIAKGMEYLHENMMFHYHLSSRNIYIDEEYNPFIADYGFHYLVDIANIFIKYKNKNSYSSPEMLKDAKNIGCHLANDENSEKIDIYSFGILLWELYSGMVPFNVKLSSIYDYVVVQNSRPEITKQFNRDIAAVIRMCWDSDPNSRPSFHKVISLLENASI